MEIDTTDKTVDEVLAEARVLRRSANAKLAGGTALCLISIACFTKAIKLLRESV